jgi:PII-like signaling protein
MAAILYPLHVPPRPWHKVGLDYLTHLPKSNDFNIVLIVVDHLTRMAHFLPCTKTVTAEETATLFYRESTVYMDYPV